MTTVPPQLFRRWIHVREEDRPGVRVYRPADCPIPPARGRDGLEFRPDGTFVDYAPGAADAPTGTPGRWAPDGEAQILLTYPAGRGQERLRILAVDDQVLQVRPLT